MSLKWSQEIEWRVCPDFPDYEVSNYGDVRRCKVCTRNRQSFKGKILKPKGWKPADIVGEIEKQMTNTK